MPGAVHYGHEITLSTEVDLRGTWTDEIVAYCKNALWYAVKTENVCESGKLHLHAAIVFEIQDASESGSNGAKTSFNVKRQLLNHSPHLSQFLQDHPSRFALKVSPLYSDEWIASYMQKEGELKYSKLPQDLNELQPYFSELQLHKPKNPEFEKLRDLYFKRGGKEPAETDAVWQFLGQLMYDPTVPADQQLKVIQDQKKFREKVVSLQHYINGTIPPMPASLKRKETEDFGPPIRYCPRCEEQGRDVGAILEPYQRYCAMCVKK